MTKIDKTHFICPICGDRRPRSCGMAHLEAHRKRGDLKEDWELYEEEPSDPYHYTPRFEGILAGLMSGVGTKKR